MSNSVAEKMSPAAGPTVWVNDKRIEVGLDASLAGVVLKLGLEEKKGVAVAVNGTVVRRAEWEGKRLSAGDRVLVIRATQGG